jgi:hypothetical protein
VLVPQVVLPAVEKPPRRVLWHANVLQGKGLFPCGRPRSNVYCPLYFFPRKWVVWPLPLVETLQLYQLPLSMDPLMQALEPDKGLPFEDSPAPDLFPSVLQQLWGTSGGGSDYGPALGDVPEAPNYLADAGDVVKEAVLGEDAGDVVEEEILEEDVTEEIGEEIYDDVTREVDIVQARPTFNTKVRDMMATNGPDL